MCIEQSERLAFILVAVISELSMICTYEEHIFKVGIIYSSENNLVRLAELAPVFHVNGHVILVNFTIVSSLDLDSIGIDIAAFLSSCHTEDIPVPEKNSDNTEQTEDSEDDPEDDPEQDPEDKPVNEELLLGLDATLNNMVESRRGGLSMLGSRVMR